MLEHSILEPLMPSAHHVEATFFTATILEWKRMLKLDKYKDIIIDSLRFLVRDGRVRVFAFVIMDNHIHIVWQIQEGHVPHKVQQSFMKYTAQQIRFDLVANHPQVLEQFRVDAKDRTYQFWERNPLSVELWTEAVMLQKIEYVHQNPTRAGLCMRPSHYQYSSASFYDTGEDRFRFLTPNERYCLKEW